MSDRIASLRLDRTTTPEQLQAFLANGNADAKVRAEKNGDGSVTLFTTDRATGWWGQLTGFSRERETARAALSLWFRSQVGPEVSPEAKQVLNSRIGAGKVDVTAVSRLAGGVRELVGQPNAPLPQPVPPPPEPLPPRHEVPRETRDGPIRTSSVLTLGGEEYRVGDELGRGGQGIVYQGVSGTGENVAIKVANRGIPSEVLERELNAHQRAVGDGRDVSHIVGLKGATTGPDGKIQALVIEHMQGGDATNLLARLATYESEGKINAEDARLIRLTVAQDMATGLRQLHEVGGLLHSDVKPDNFLVSGDGVVKISDFGTVQPEEEMRGQGLAGVASTFKYMSPEMLHGAVRVLELNSEIERLKSRAKDERYAKESLINLAQCEKLQNEIDTTAVDCKADIFALGLNLAFTFEGTNLGIVSNASAELGALGTGSEAEREAVLRALGITSDSTEHTLIRAMLSGNPEDRPTAREVLESPLFDDPRIGSKETRKLLLDVAQGSLGDPPDGERH